LSNTSTSAQNQSRTRRPIPMSDGERAECPYCWGEGGVKRRYGTVGPGPAKRVKQRECPVCEGAGDVPEEAVDL
jgi:DnaJ-class molecular chaperone